MLPFYAPYMCGWWILFELHIFFFFFFQDLINFPNFSLSSLSFLVSFFCTWALPPRLVTYEKEKGRE
jgi:hypothetical protein